MSKRIPSPSTTTSNPVVSGMAVDTPPEGFGMKPPDGFAPRQGSMLVRPRLATHAQLVAAPTAVNEFRNDGNYQALLGSTGIAGSDLANALYNAYAWSMTARNTRAYLTYARIQEASAWHHAWTLLDVVRPMAEALAKASTRFATAFPSIVRFFDVRRAVGRKAAATHAYKKANGIAPARRKKRGVDASGANGLQSSTPTTAVTPPVMSLTGTLTASPANDAAHSTGGTPPTTPTRAA